MPTVAAIIVTAVPRARAHGEDESVHTLSQTCLRMVDCQDPLPLTAHGSECEQRIAIQRARLVPHTTLSGGGLGILLHSRPVRRLIQRC